MKKLISIVLCLVMIMSLCSCSANSPAPATDTTAETAAAKEEAVASKAEEKKDDITITLWVCSLVSTNDLQLDESEWWLSQSIERFLLQMQFIVITQKN